MEKNKKLVGILHGITTFIFYFTILIAALAVVAGIFVQFVPIPEIGDGFLQSTVVYDNSFTFDFALKEGADFLPIINRIIVMIVTGMLTITGFTYLLRRVLKNVKNDKVFIEENSILIKYLGYALIGTSILISALRFWVAAAVMNVVQFPGGHFGANFSFNFQTIFIGLIIIVLSQIFAYGTHLQNEYDATV